MSSVGSISGGAASVVDGATVVGATVDGAAVVGAAVAGATVVEVVVAGAPEVVVAEARTDDVEPPHAVATRAIDVATNASFRDRFTRKL